MFEFMDKIVSETVRAALSILLLFQQVEGRVLLHRQWCGRHARHVGNAGGLRGERTCRFILRPSRREPIVSLLIYEEIPIPHGRAKRVSRCGVVDEPSR